MFSEPFLESFDDSEPWGVLFESEQPLPCDPCDLCCILAVAEDPSFVDDSPKVLGCTKFFYSCGCPGGELTLERQAGTSGAWTSVPQVNWQANRTFYLPFWERGEYIDVFPFFLAYRYRLRCTLASGESYVTSAFTPTDGVDEFGCMQAGEWKYYIAVYVLDEYYANWNGVGWDFGSFVGEASFGRSLTVLPTLEQKITRFDSVDLRTFVQPGPAGPPPTYVVESIWSQSLLSDYKCTPACDVVNESLTVGFDQDNDSFIGFPVSAAYPGLSPSLWRSYYKFKGLSLTLSENP